MSFEIISNDYDTNKLNYIREQLENMSKFNQVEVLRILTKNKNTIINENKYGIHINLSELQNSVLNELMVYIKYVNTEKIINRKDFETKVEKTNNKIEENVKHKKYERKKETMYKPKQKDSLFWCFYILKNGFSNYEMEINNQYFVVEKNEKFKYIDLLRKNKDLLKMHKIKPLTQLEDELANKDKISPKTFFALCALENINVLLVDKRKVYELLCVDIDETHPINIVHRNNTNYEHLIELEVTEEIINKYRETYYKLTSFDTTLKSIGSYKLEELIDLCKKLNIDIEEYKNNKLAKQKITKKDIYELLVLNY
jgi:hypothetical protein